MKNNTFIVEPCCAEKQIPALLSGNRLAVFQTNGDVTFEHLLKSIACLAGNKVELQIFAPEISIEMLRTLSWYIRRGWVESLSVITATPQSILIMQELGDLIVIPRCYSNKRITEGTIIVKGQFGTVALWGALLSTPAPGLRNYAVSFAPEAAVETKALAASLSCFLHPRNMDSLEADSASEPAPVESSEAD